MRTAYREHLDSFSHDLIIMCDIVHNTLKLASEALIESERYYFRVMYHVEARKKLVFYLNWWNFWSAHAADWIQEFRTKLDQLEQKIEDAKTDIRNDITRLETFLYKVRVPRLEIVPSLFIDTER